MKILKYTEGSTRLMYAAAVTVAVLVFFIKFTPHVLNPSHFDWLMSYADMPTEYISWLFYRATPWTFPVVGTLSGYDFPTVSGVGLTGAIPLLAIPIKIFTHGQNVDFQYFGWWFLICYILQAYFSVRLLRGLFEKYKLKITNYELFAGAIFFIVSPALLTRTGHMNLCGQWLILWAFCGYFERRRMRQKFYFFLKIIAVTALIHQYLLLMMLGIAFAAFWQSERFWRFSWLRKLGFSLINLAVAAALWYIIGNFNNSPEAMTQIGFGKFSANLNTFFNGQNEQRLLPTLAFNDGQYEGFGYLGAGVLLAAAVVFAVFLKNKNRQFQFSPLAFVACFFAAFAFSHIWTFGHTRLFEAKFLYENVGIFNYLAQAFRASGRFIWILHYWLLTQIVFALLKINFSKTLKISVLSLVLAVQFFDISPMLVREKKYFDMDGYAPSVMTPEIWSKITAEASRIVMLPLYSWSYRSEGDYIHFARLAAIQNQSITTGYLARPDWKNHEIYKKNIAADLERGALGDETNSIFIAGKRAFRKLKPLADSGVVRVFQFQEYAVAVPLAFEKTIQYLSQLADCQPITFDAEGLPTFLENHKNATILAVVRDEAAFKLCDEAKAVFDKMGATAAAKLAFRASYVGIFAEGKAIFEHSETEKPVVEAFKKGQILRGLNLKSDIRLESGGSLTGNFGNIFINGKNVSMGVRGFNFVVLDKKFNVIKTAYFDTFDDCFTGEVVTPPVGR